MAELTTQNYKVCFIIAHKYFRGWESYLNYYVNNIFEYYESPLVVIVDNNSKYKDDIFQSLDKKNDVVLLDNDIESKFEMGAYQVGLKYIVEKNLQNEYDYVVLTQDNFILNKKLDFNNLIENNIHACPINSYYPDGEFKGICDSVLNSIGMNDNLDKLTFCWCVSFIIGKKNTVRMYEITKKIKQTVRAESCASERYLARILWELNDYKNNDIDGDIRDLRNKYDCWTVDPYNKNIDSFFIKKVQQKNEHTIDKE
jgi:hypothetical protein